MCSSGRYPWKEQLVEKGKENETIIFDAIVMRDHNHYRLDMLPLDICGETTGCAYDRDILAAFNSYLNDPDHPDHYICNVLESFAAQNYGCLESAYLAASGYITNRERGLECIDYINDALYRFFQCAIESVYRPMNNALFVLDLLLCLDSNKRYGWNGKEETK